MSKTPEGRVKDRIRQFLDGAGCVWSSPIGSSYGTSDMCDFIVCVPQKNGHALYLEIEAKPDKNEPLTARQKDKMRRLTEVNGLAWRVDKDNYDEFKQQLSTLVGKSVADVDAQIQILRAQRKAPGANIRRRLLARQPT